MKWSSPFLVPAALLVHGVAWAQSQPAVDDDDLRQARELYDTGVRHYNVLEYDKAVEVFKRAYLLTRTPSLLYNIAQAYRKKGPTFCAEAASFYRSYLRERTNAPDRADIEAKIVETDRCAESERARTAPARPSGPSAATTAPAEPVRGRPTLPLWIAGGGAVLALSGAALYGAALAKYRSLEDECPCAPERWKTWQTLTYTSYGLLAAGGAIAVGGATWYFVQPRPRADQTGVDSVGVAATPSGIVVRGAFF